MTAPPPVTVYMPAYNVGPFVRQAVESILNQTFGDFEFIVIDDGSTDDTLAVLKELEARDSRIRLVSRPNMGVSRTANEAIALARGEFLARIDGDDVAQATRLEKQLIYLRAHSQCVAVGCGVLLIDEDGLPLYMMPQVEFDHERIEAALWSGGWPMVQPACMFRRDAVVAVGGYRTHLSLHEDHDLFLRLAERGTLENLPDVLQWYRQRLTSLTYTESSGSKRVMAGILRETRQRRGLPALPDAAAEGNGVAKISHAALARCRQWGWMSLKARHIPTARKYAAKAVRLAPFSADSWRLMYCAWRGR
ncbi:MAG TPA: glycosyltransferase [Tepidisphaeraceae bacterium]|jgi:glycosyltransferase involved in cell wall biosynthesis|nr:glycosyltransferase [Tepidisphaeraceae bacterium]